MIATFVRDWSNVVLVLYVLLALWAEYRRWKAAQWALTELGRP